jgi:acetylornithine/N-succinyldiaminopimelate aminotransferase
MSSSGELFRKYLAQTSESPIALEITRAEGSWLYSKDGRRYLDFIAGIGVSNIGHGHPAVLAAINEQARRHLHVMVYGEYVIDPQVRLAERIANLLPHPLKRVYFTNSGAEAIEGALKTARKATGRAIFAAFDGAYHGDTMAALSLMGNESFRAPFEPLPGPVLRLPYNDEAALQSISHEVAAVVIEPIQAEGGVRIPSRNFMTVLRERCNQTGALLIFDEVLTGFGRTGRLLALEHYGVTPDLIVMAKALGGGLPLGAFCGAPELMNSLAHDPPLGHITTFGGHPLSCAAGLASLEVITTGRLLQRAERLGERLRARLEHFKGREVIAIRGIGMLAGIEFAEANLARRFVAETLARGVVINWTLNADRVVRIAPPLTLVDDELDFAIAAMSSALEACRGRVDRAD